MTSSRDRGPLLFSSLHWFAMGLRSGDGDGHEKSLILSGEAFLLKDPVMILSFQAEDTRF